jgi:hypothetical protein
VLVTGHPTSLASPVANWESLAASGPTISVRGWAWDPDSPLRALPVHAYVDGTAVPITAGDSRPDVGAAFPGIGDQHGFSWSGTVSPGTHNVCLYAIDLVEAVRNTGLGCRSVATQVALPVANWEGLSASGSTVSVWGWALDRDDPDAAVPVHVYVDGRVAMTSANSSRPDVAAAFPGTGSTHGFGWSGTVAPGTHSVCLYAIDVELPLTHTELGCRSVTT